MIKFFLVLYFVSLILFFANPWMPGANVDYHEREKFWKKLHTVSLVLLITSVIHWLIS